jgi:antitoxin ParD1/3/4
MGAGRPFVAVDNSSKLTEAVAGMSKVITPHFEKLIDRFVASGRFNNKSEVIRAGLRLLEEHEANAAPASRDDLSRIIETALMDPRPLIPAANLLRRRQRR